MTLGLACAALFRSRPSTALLSERPQHAYRLHIGVHHQGERDRPKAASKAYRIEAGCLLDVIENAAERVAKKDGSNGSQ